MAARWTAGEEMALAALWGDGMSVPEIARRLGRSAGSVYAKIKTDRDRCPSRVEPPPPPEPPTLAGVVAYRLRLEGWEYEDIAWYLGMSCATVRGYVER